jgi:hypothetical protein
MVMTPLVIMVSAVIIAAAVAWHGRGRWIKPPNFAASFDPR